MERFCWLYRLTYKNIVLDPVRFVFFKEMRIEGLKSYLFFFQVLGKNFINLIYRKLIMLAMLASIALLGAVAMILRWWIG